jgi:hypothetical protein
MENEFRLALVFPFCNFRRIRSVENVSQIKTRWSEISGGEQAPSQDCRMAGSPCVGLAMAVFRCACNADNRRRQAAQTYIIR